MGQTAGYGPPLLLPAGERTGLVVDAVFQPQAGEYLGAALVVPTTLGREQLERHFHVLPGGQRLEEVMGLEDEPQLAAQLDQLVRRGPAQLPPQDRQAPLLHGPQRSDKGQQRGLSRAGGTGHDDDLAAGNFEAVVEEDLFFQFPLAEGMLHVGDPHGKTIMFRHFSRS